MPYRNYAKPATAVATPEVNTEVDMKVEQAAPNHSNGEAKEVPAWLSKIKEGGVKKIPKEVQKRRRNFRLKKMLTPKPPMMVLFELVNHNEIQFENFISDPMTRLLRITARYDGKMFEGIGPSKSIAKNICSEQILQHIAFKSCMKDAENGSAAVNGSHGEEETPWTALASIALFKLFNDWQSQGVDVPADLMRRAPPAPAMGGAGMGVMAAHEDQVMNDVEVKQESSPKQQKPKKERGPKQLPENPTSRHPVQLLNEMEGQLEYTTSVNGAPPNAIFDISVTLSNQTFKGSAKNKKDAKRFAAQAALQAIYNVVYPVETM